MSITFTGQGSDLIRPHNTEKLHQDTPHEANLYGRRPTQDLGKRLVALALQPELRHRRAKSLTSRAKLGASYHLVRLTHVLFLLFSKEKDGRQSSSVCGFDLRLSLWSVDIGKYFLGMPSPKLPIGTSVFSKMKTLNKEVEPNADAEPIMSEWCHPPAPWSRPGWPASSATFGCTRSAPLNWPRPGS